MSSLDSPEKEIILSLATHEATARAVMSGCDANVVLRGGPCGAAAYFIRGSASKLRYCFGGALRWGVEDKTDIEQNKPNQQNLEIYSPLLNFSRNQTLALEGNII